MRNTALYSAGLLMGAANAVRHKRQGYVRPRPFSAKDVDQTIRHAIATVDRLEERGAIDWRGKRILEIGPGPDLTTGAVMLHRGAESYRAVDLFDNRGQAHPDIYEMLGAIRGQSTEVDRLAFTLATFPGLPELDGEYDLIVSNATLEHVDNVAAVFTRLRDLAAPGARMAHHVDGQTHMRFIKDADPLNILRYGERVYRKALSFPGAPNRLRGSDFELLAERAGWSNVAVIPGRVADPAYLRWVRVASQYRGTAGCPISAFSPSRSSLTPCRPRSAGRTRLRG